MPYTVKMTMYAIAQTREILSYISHVLQSPHSAVAWSSYLQKEIKSLCTLPARFPCVAQEPWKSKGIRKTNVKNFIVYYFIDEPVQTVWITSVVYGKRNQIEQLKEMPL